MYAKSNAPALLQVATTLADDEYITAAQINPNIVHQPDISFDKFMNMWKDVNKDYGECHANMKKSGSHKEWHSYSRGKLWCSVVVCKKPLCNTCYRFRHVSGGG